MYKCTERGTEELGSVRELSSADRNFIQDMFDDLSEAEGYPSGSQIGTLEELFPEEEMG